VPTPTPSPAAEPVATDVTGASLLVRAGAATTHLRVLAPVLVVVMVAMLNVALHVRTYTLVGPIDELQHIDSLYKSPGIVRSGDRIGQDAMREQACRGLDFDPFELPACGTDVYDPAQFQENGYNTAAINTPLYYTATRALGTVVVWLTPTDSLVTGARLVGGLWLALGLVMAYAAARRLGAHRWTAAAVLVTVACLPSVVYPSSTVGPDSMTFGVGSAVLLTVLWWRERPTRRWPALAAVSALVLAVKLTNIVVLVALVLFLLVQLARAWRAGDRRAARTPLVAIATVGTTAVVVAGGWSALFLALAHGDRHDVPMTLRFAADSLDPQAVLAAWGVWLVPVQGWPLVAGVGYSALLQSLGVLLVPAGLVATALFGRPQPGARLAAWSMVAVGAFGPPAFVVANYVLQGSVWPVPARYGASMAATMVVLTILAVRDRGPRWVLVAVAPAAVAISVLRLL